MTGRLPPDGWHLTPRQVDLLLIYAAARPGSSVVVTVGRRK